MEPKFLAPELQQILRHQQAVQDAVILTAGQVLHVIILFVLNAPRVLEAGIVPVSTLELFLKQAHVVLEPQPPPPVPLVPKPAGIRIRPIL